MRWQGRRQSTNIRDVRTAAAWAGGSSGGLGGGRGGPFVVRRAGGGGIGAIIVVLIIAWVFGINPLELLPAVARSGPRHRPSRSANRAGVSDEMRDFVATVLADTEDTWKQIFSEAGETYPEPTLTLFSDSVQLGLRVRERRDRAVLLPRRPEPLHRPWLLRRAPRSASARPATSRRPMCSRTRSAITCRTCSAFCRDVHQRQQSMGEAEANALSVRTELQADCFAGIWANRTEQTGTISKPATSTRR